MRLLLSKPALQCLPLPAKKRALSPLPPSLSERALIPIPKQRAHFRPGYTRLLRLPFGVHVLHSVTLNSLTRRERYTWRPTRRVQSLC